MEGIVISKREIFGKYLAYFIFVVWFSTEILFNTSMEYFMFWKREDANDTMAVVILLLSIIQISLFQKYSIREMYVISIISVAMIVCTFTSGNNIMLSAWIFILLAKYMDFDMMILFSYIILILTIAIVLYMFFSGNIDEVLKYRKGIIRHSWGFAHPNWLGVRVFELIVAHCYVRRNKIKIYDALLILLGIFFTYKVPNCQTAYVCLGLFLILLVLYFLSDFFVNGKSFFCKIIIYLALFSNVFSITMSLINVKRITLLSKLDKLLSLRFSNCYRTIKYFGIHLTGTNVNLYSKKMGLIYAKFYLDTAYTSILVRYGVIVYIVFSALYIYAMIYWYKKRNYMIVIIFGVYAMYGIMENTLYSLTQNIFLLAIAYPLYNKEFIDNTIEKAHKRIKITFGYGV